MRRKFFGSSSFGGWKLCADSTRDWSKSEVFSVWFRQGIGMAAASDIKTKVPGQRKPVGTLEADIAPVFVFIYRTGISCKKFREPASASVDEAKQTGVSEEQNRASFKGNRDLTESHISLDAANKMAERKTDCSGISGRGSHRIPALQKTCFSQQVPGKALRQLWFAG